MSRFIITIIVAALIYSIPIKISAQFFNDLKKHVEKKVESEAQHRTEKKADEAVDKTFDSVEGALEGNETGQNQNDTPSGEQQNQLNENVNNQNENVTGAEESQMQAEEKTHTIVWAKFDFVPGDKVVFEDKPSEDEENGEFPSRWDLLKGNAEIAEFDGEPVIIFLDGGYILPYLKNSKEDYLPDVFTIEFDAYFVPGRSFTRYWVYFNDLKNQSREIKNDLEIYVNGLNYSEFGKRYPGTKKYNWGDNPEGGWKHISIAYTKGKFKAYMDDTRLINIPHFEGNPTGLTIQAENKKDTFIKNIRIAAGGVKYYDRVLSDGKIIVNGIKFDVNKATLKPESMGPINKIYKLIKKKPELKFSVEGHTDSDGDEAHNLELSKQRAKTVMDKLIALGISPDRLQYTGFGESKPIDTNDTEEGKANNRRVEFVKF